MRWELGRGRCGDGRMCGLMLGVGWGGGFGDGFVFWVFVEGGGGGERGLGFVGYSWRMMRRMMRMSGANSGV